MKFRNPVISGSYGDPSVCRVGHDYYTVHSSGAAFPAVPIMHSRDLVHWRRLGYCLTRESQVSFDQSHTRYAGVYAPTLRHHDGVFYMITTNVGGAGHFYVTATDPAGEWSDPIYVEGPGFDPDLFFDDDGTVYFQREDIGGHGIRQWRIDIATGQLLGDEHLIWEGHEDRLCEAPHIYRINGHYYLIVAEGHTLKGHMVVVARSDHPTGPFEGCPFNPILTHRHHVLHPIQSVGHGDLVQSPDGQWWMLFLGLRKVNEFNTLGRETFLAPISWTQDGWPVVNEGQPIEYEMDAHLPPLRPWPDEPLRDDFTNTTLALPWNFRGNPAAHAWSLTERPGWLTLHGQALTLNDAQFKSFLSRRQEHLRCRVTTRLDFEPSAAGQEAGLTVIMDEHHHYEVAVTQLRGTRSVLVRRRIGDLEAVVAHEPLVAGPVVLQIEADLERYRLGICSPHGAFRELATGASRYLSTELTHGLGVHFGLYATGGGQAGGDAAFDWFDYEPLGDT